MGRNRIKVGSEYMPGKPKTLSLKLTRLKYAFGRISDVEPNREYKEIVFPLQPVLRMASPAISTSGVVFGVIVINANFDALSQVFMHPPDNVKYFISNADGDYIFHPTVEKKFAAAFGGRAGLMQEFPEIDWLQLKHDEKKFVTFDLPERTAIASLQLS